MEIRRVQPVSGSSTNFRTRSNLEEGIINPVKQQPKKSEVKKEQDAFEVIFSRKAQELIKTNAKSLKR